MAEQKSKLMTTITLNDNYEELDIKSILKKDLIADPIEDKSEDISNNIEGESEDSFQMNVFKFKEPEEYKKFAHNKEEQKGYDKVRDMKINNSKKFREDAEDNQNPGRQLRVGSFASFQGFGDGFESGANNSLYGDATYLDKNVQMIASESKRYEPEYHGKYS
jgi:hypothetical protein